MSEQTKEARRADGVQGRTLSEDEATAVKFYAENPSAALFDLNQRLARPAGVAPARPPAVGDDIAAIRERRIAGVETDRGGAQ